MGECKPCKKEIKNLPKKCKPFTVCVGNKSLVFDGTCLHALPRKIQIPAGTYTSITLDENGCIVDAGTAPVPVYTPQACCDPAEKTDAELMSRLLDAIEQDKTLKQRLKKILGV